MTQHQEKREEIRELRRTLTDKDKYHEILDSANISYPESIEKVLFLVEVIVECTEGIEEVENGSL